MCAKQCRFNSTKLCCYYGPFVYGGNYDLFCLGKNIFRKVSNAAILGKFFLGLRQCALFRLINLVRILASPSPFL